jgi:hypothetical protein
LVSYHNIITGSNPRRPRTLEVVVFWDDSSRRNLLLQQFKKRVVKLTVIIIEESPSYQLPTKFYLTFFWPGYLLMSMTLLGIISVGSVVTDLLRIRFSTFGRY